MRVINKHYGRSVKESSLSPPGGFHTQESALSIIRSPTIGGVLNYTQQDLPDRRKTKDSKDMQGLFGLWVTASVEALLNMHPYIRFLLVVH